MKAPCGVFRWIRSSRFSVNTVPSPVSGSGTGHWTHPQHFVRQSEFYPISGMRSQFFFVHPKGGGFKRNTDNWLECDLLVVDETSMVDILLMQALPSALTAWPFETAPTYFRGVELGAIRIWPVVAANGSFRCCHQSLGCGDAARPHGADLRERLRSDYRSHDQRVHCQLEHTQAIPLVRQNRNDDTWHAYPAS